MAKLQLTPSHCLQQHRTYVASFTKHLTGHNIYLQNRKTKEFKAIVYTFQDTAPTPYTCNILDEPLCGIKLN